MLSSLGLARRQFAHRLIFFEQPDSLPAAKLAVIKKWRTERIVADDEDVPWMTIPKALREADKLLSDVTEGDARLLQEVKGFLSDLAERVAAD
jgi:hypothetical protein